MKIIFSFSIRCHLMALSAPRKLQPSLSHLHASPPSHKPTSSIHCYQALSSRIFFTASLSYALGSLGYSSPWFSQPSCTYSTAPPIGSLWLPCYWSPALGTQAVGHRRRESRSSLPLHILAPSALHLLTRSQSRSTPPQPQAALAGQHPPHRARKQPLLKL